MAATVPRPPNICWITETFYPPIVGGQEFLAHALTQGLARKGCGVQVITRQTRPQSAPFERLGDVAVTRIAPAGILKGHGWKAVFPLIRYLVNLASLLIRERRRYDIIVVSSIKIMPLVVVPLCRLLGKSCILRAESIFELSEAISAESLSSMGGSLGKAALALLGAVRNRMLRGADRVIAISTEIEQKLLSIGVRGARIARIANAVDLARFHPVATEKKLELKKSLDLPPDRCHVIYVGRLSRAKGLPLLLAAWPAVLAAHPQLCLLIVGAGNVSFDDCESFLVDFIRTHRLENDVKLLGERKNVQEYLQAADLFLFPTEYEGFSLVLIEALGCGLPAVVTCVGAAPDFIEHGRNGFLFPPKDAQALIEAVDAAVRHRSQWDKIGEQARRTAERFDFPVIVERYVDLCRGLR
jgi:glycosyltransferase involved in cell wall biosynthesis